MQKLPRGIAIKIFDVPGPKLSGHTADTQDFVLDTGKEFINNGAKLDFFGHQKKHPMAEAYFSQTPYRYRDYVAKIGVIPDTSGLKALFEQPYDPQTPDAFREVTNEFSRTQPDDTKLRSNE